MLSESKRAGTLTQKCATAFFCAGSIMAWTLDHLPLVVRVPLFCYVHGWWCIGAGTCDTLLALQDGQDPTQYTMRVHSYSPKWAVQGKDYEAVSYQFPPLRCVASLAIVFNHMCKHFV